MIQPVCDCTPICCNTDKLCACIVHPVCYINVLLYSVSIHSWKVSGSYLRTVTLCSRASNGADITNSGTVDVSSPFAFGQKQGTWVVFLMGREDDNDQEPRTAHSNVVWYSEYVLITMSNVQRDL